MRDNGLPAQAWTHVADLDPWLTDAALDALREAGVAAYITPHPGHTGAYLDVRLPDRPTDRLYVEVGAQERAAVVLAHLGPRPGQRETPPAAGGTPTEVDAAFAAIVAAYDLDAAVEPPVGAPPDPQPTGTGRVLRDATGWEDLFFDEHLRAKEPPEEPEDRFVPPPPPPVPRGTPLRRFAWTAVLGAPIVVVLCLMFSYRLDDWVGLVVVGAFVAGLVTLFATLEDRDDDSDDGAVV